jgi:hypothetical protein
MTYKVDPLTHMNPYEVETEVQLASGWQEVIIGIWENRALARPPTYGAKLYMNAAARFALPALRIVASVLEEDDFEVPADR